MAHARRPQMVVVLLLLLLLLRRWWCVRSPFCGRVYVRAAVFERGVVGPAQAVERVRLVEDGGDGDGWGDRWMADEAAASCSIYVSRVAHMIRKIEGRTRHQCISGLICAR